MISPRYITTPETIEGLSLAERRQCAEVAKTYAFRANDYYLSLIDWNDPEDPIRRIVVPDPGELESWGVLDASDEKSYTKVPGLEHKYEHTVVLLVNDVCGAFCRFCFRKRLFMGQENETVRDVSAGLAYIREHTEVNNVLLTGGDPLLLSTARLETIIAALRSIPHVRIIRLGTKIPAFNPRRITGDSAFLAMITRFSTIDNRIYVMCHFNHPRELTSEARAALQLLQRAGAITVNQTPIIRGVNDSPEVLADLYETCSFLGVIPYYLFQCRPTCGNGHLAVPLEEAYIIHEQAKMRCSGLAKRARFVMSHAQGKIEVLALDDRSIYLKLHRAANYAEKARLFVYPRNPDAYWFDDYAASEREYQIPNPFYTVGAP